MSQAVNLAVSGQYFIRSILETVSARIRIIQITAHAVIIPVKRQRFCLAAEVAVFGEEGRRYHAVVPCSQILALDIRIVGFSVVGVFVLILRSTKGDLSGDAVTVGLVDLSLFIGDAGDTSSGIVEVVAGAAIIPRTAFPSIFYFTTPTIVCIHHFYLRNFVQPHPTYIFSVIVLSFIVKITQYYIIVASFSE